MIAITIAGYDPSGGAGILSDIKTMSALGVYGTGVVTALTSQNPKKFFSLETVDSDYISEQIDSIFDEYRIKYGKTGMLYSKEIIKLISEKIDQYDLKIVVDPVMTATSGADLSNNKTAKALVKYLLPKSILTTPNISEAEKLSNIKINNKEDLINSAKKIGKYTDVLITGGHNNGDNVFYNGDINIIHQDLIKTDNLHGTGCSLSSAVVSNMVKSNDLNQSIESALNFVYESVKFGHYGTLNQFYRTKI